MINSRELAIKDLQNNPNISQDDVNNNINYYTSQFSEFNADEYLNTINSEYNNFGFLGYLGREWIVKPIEIGQRANDWYNQNADRKKYRKKLESGKMTEGDLKALAKRKGREQWNLNLYGTKVPTSGTVALHNLRGIKNWGGETAGKIKHLGTLAAAGLGSSKARQKLENEAKVNYVTNKVMQIGNALGIPMVASEPRDDLNSNSMASYCNDFSHIQDFTGANHSDFSKQEIDQINDRWESILSY